MTLFAGLAYRQTPQIFWERGRVREGTRISNLIREIPN